MKILPKKEEKRAFIQYNFKLDPTWQQERRAWKTEEPMCNATKSKKERGVLEESRLAHAQVGAATA
eukprot:1156686-Pelagomonas_calceolata.AAC.4